MVALVQTNKRKKREGLRAIERCYDDKFPRNLAVKKDDTMWTLRLPALPSPMGPSGEVADRDGADALGGLGRLYQMTMAVTHSC